MTQAVEIKDALLSTEVLLGRTPDTPDEDVEKAFATIAHSPDSGIYAGSFQGQSAWERHPSGDELVQVIDGMATVTVIIDSEHHVLEMTRGMVTMVPKGCWHRFDVPDHCSVMTMTPAPTEHFRGEDPTK